VATQLRSKPAAQSSDATKDLPFTLKAIEDVFNMTDRIKDIPKEAQTLVKYTLLDHLNRFLHFVSRVTPRDVQHFLLDGDLIERLQTLER
jgi:hypothetical protein